MTEQMRKIDIVLYVLKKSLFLIENEFHLIVECEYYATLRNTYFEKYLLEKWIFKLHQVYWIVHFLW